jgi:microcystin-dependent protein
MADYSRDTFNKLKHYVGVRLQQGVPLIDADWNEKEDIHKNELQLFLKWFAGNGIPKDNDGFHIMTQAGLENDFLITGGTNGQPGICLVEGWDIRNETDITYRAQPLFNKDVLAQKWGVAALPALTLPTSGQRTDLVYLDAWEREVNSQEDSNLVNPAIGLETCVRIKREWVVRVAEGTAALPTVPDGHVYYALSTIIRRAGQPIIAQADIADLRKTGLSIISDPITINNNNVGIGTTDPTVKLEVSGRIKDQTGYVMPAGGIIMWKGTANDIPQGWALCDGTNGTPNLKDRFIVGAGNTYNPGTTGGQAAVSLKADEMPAHGHTVTIDSAGNHTHPITPYIYEHYRSFAGENANDHPYKNNSGTALEFKTGSAGNHTHGATTTNAGSGTAHDNIPPYYALCFIMKL